MPLKVLELSESHHLLWDRLMEDRAVQIHREEYALKTFLKELGGRLDQPWQFDREHRKFWLNDEPTEDHHEGTTTAAVPAMAG